VKLLINFDVFSSQWKCISGWKYKAWKRIAHNSRIWHGKICHHNWLYVIFLHKGRYNTFRWSQYDQYNQKFQRPEGHENPTSRVPPLYSTTFSASDVAVGVYQLNDTQINMFTSWEPCHLKKVPDEVLKWTDSLVLHTSCYLNFTPRKHAQLISRYDRVHH